MEQNKMEKNKEQWIYFLLMCFANGAAITGLLAYELSFIFALKYLIITLMLIEWGISYLLLVKGKRPFSIMMFGAGLMIFPSFVILYIPLTLLLLYFGLHSPNTGF